MEARLINCKDDLISKDFEKAEKLLGITFPKSFKKLLYGCDGGYLEGSLSFFDRGIGRVSGAAIGVFLSFKPQEELEIKPWEIDEDALIENCDKAPKPVLPEIVEENLNPPEYFLDSLVVFAVDGGGNYFCFDYRSGKDNLDPPVVFWQHEGPCEDKNGDEDLTLAISPLAENFESFIAQLKPESEIETAIEMLEKQHPSKD